MRDASGNLMPVLQEPVNVHEPEDSVSDGWVHGFTGIIIDIAERKGKETLYVVEDQDGDVFQMKRSQFDIGRQS